MKSDPPETVSAKVQSYLDEALSLQELSAWLLSKTAYFANESQGAAQSYDANFGREHVTLSPSLVTMLYRKMR